METSLTLPVRKVIAVLGGAAATAVLLSLPAPLFRHVLGHDYVRGFVPFAEAAFDLNSEANFPTWVAASLLLVAALVLAVIGLAERARRRPWVRHWLVLAAVFVYLSADEAATIHEQANAIRDVIGAGGVLYYPWVLFGGALVLILAITYFGFLRALPSRTRSLFILAAVLFVGGALGLELSQAYYADSLGDQYTSWSGRVLLTHLEETMELAGVVVFIYALLDYVRRYIGPLRLDLAGAKQE